ncbi:hypothetical protein H6P81_014582 [Aristolochia fimbriata]|uniref:Uncharacterized protein n=1 Tax=Aristolochia fimbriata TaxID=158543 RepID=A0AAV7E338_ARIFI|nr:hypothetical protein H6P81_014582 [Aristolochia fimbriata]
MDSLAGKYISDIVLVPLGVFVTVAYHLFLWQSLKKKKPRTSIGADFARRKIWVVDVLQRREKKGMLAVQSLRNGMMTSILCGSLAVILNVALAALSNNAHDSGEVVLQQQKSSYDVLILFVFGSESSGSLLALKYASCSFLLLTSFLFSSMATVHFIDASFLLPPTITTTVSSHTSDSSDSDHLHLHHVSPALPNYSGNNKNNNNMSNIGSEGSMERGHVLGVAGSRVLYITLPILFWLLLGPFPMLISSFGLVSILYLIDFSA